MTWLVEAIQDTKCSQWGWRNFALEEGNWNSTPTPKQPRDNIDNEIGVTLDIHRFKTCYFLK